MRKPVALCFSRELWGVWVSPGDDTRRGGGQRGGGKMSGILKNPLVWRLGALWGLLFPFCLLRTPVNFSSSVLVFPRDRQNDQLPLFPPLLLIIITSPPNPPPPPLYRPQQSREEKSSYLQTQFQPPTWPQPAIKPKIAPTSPTQQRTSPPGPPPPSPSSSNSPTPPSPSPPTLTRAFSSTRSPASAARSCTSSP